MQEKEKTKKDKAPSKFIRFTGTAFQMGGTIFLGNYFGKWLDTKYGTDYLETTVTLFSVFAAMYMVIAQVIKISKEDD
ncbi:putative F0F1-ATPase subunit (Ca2+/Mg2+ transporter) [Winogradskyella wandonensis]|uniref:Putative F0F1-ATPase subunit (Ca2+/Mg2+ transporter) n=1 Tax=Winogradskyella wandonensis TaxID=1442586 RepID=A0A4R1KRX3_9FLAO|nr:AtpZ/AtpI family protein [Winogradskyella wandonensis]TCK67774.1 putative F0F1-ATPase subunit (Ca2+/Mg2+ transporter) [Winogradskyella wandonensis]